MAKLFVGCTGPYASDMGMCQQRKVLPPRQSQPLSLQLVASVRQTLNFCPNFLRRQTRINNRRARSAHNRCMNRLFKVNSLSDVPRIATAFETESVSHYGCMRVPNYALDLELLQWWRLPRA
ncbi:hypothetical protein RSAG8_00083, partial [Rhizoctonia solani AG-8 WAC10335]